MAAKIKELRQEKADLVKEARANLDAHVDGWKARADALDTKIEGVDELIRYEEAQQDRERALAVFPGERFQEREHAEVKKEREIASGLPKPFASFGEQLQAVQAAAVEGARPDPRLGQIQAAASGLNETVGSEGAFAVQADFATELFQRLTTTGEIVKRCRHVPVSGNGLKMLAIDETTRVNGSRWGAISAKYIGEAGAATASKPKLRLMEWSLKKLIGLGYITDELLADAVALGSIMEQAFLEELTFVHEDKIVNGTGAGTPLGVLLSPCLVSVAKESGQAADTIVAANIVKMWSRMWAGSRANSCWCINQDAEPSLFTMTIGGTAAVPVYLPPGGFNVGPYAKIMGRDVVPLEQCATLGDKGDVLFCDWSQYLCIEKGPVQQATSIHVKFDTDETAFRFIVRNDGQPLWHAPLTPFKGSATKSPFISLDERA